ncbi:MAG: type I-C CRISPR-associated protein Cas8c/Csd1 [Rubripirellula sp.]
MSWINDLYETYQNCYGNDYPGVAKLMPVCHTTQNAHIEVVIDVDGNFRRASVIEQGNATLVPCTEDSATRSGSKPVNHPLCDKLQYIAGDFTKFGGEVTSGYKKDPTKPFATYVHDLAAWASSEYSHPKVQAILNYVKQENTVADLIKSKIIPIEEDTGLQLKEWQGEREKAPKIFKVLPKGYEPLDALIRWKVEAEEDVESATGSDEALIESWIKFYTSSLSERGYCFAQGTEAILADKHPSKIRHGGDKAKIVSSNDSSGFTFRGKFLEVEQAARLGFDVSQKSHNSLRWLIERQGYRNGDLVFVAWSPRGTLLPDPFANSSSFFSKGTPVVAKPQPAQHDVGQYFATRLRKALSGYKAELLPNESVVVIGIDSATPGRLSVIMHRKVAGSEFIERIERWHSSFAWHQNYSKKLKFVGAPSPVDIAEAAYGKKLDEKLKQATVQRIVPCIIDGARFPTDILFAAVNRMRQRMAMDEWEWNKFLGITCAIFRGSSLQKNREYKMAIEAENTSRDYLYGRLLAIADHIESRALYLADENRDTNAARSMQRFADFPFSTWRTIELAIVPYRSQLRSKRPGMLQRLEAEIDDVMSKFSSTDFKMDEQLSGEFLLAFHCQRRALWNVKDSATSEDKTNKNEGN